MARYTPNVGKWHLRAVTLLLTAMIAGGQTVIILCNAWCVAHRPTTTAAMTSSDVAQNAHHHHASDDQAGASRPDRDVTAPNLHTLLNVSSADCCTTLDAGPVTLATARAEHIGVLAPYVTAFVDAFALDSSHRQVGPPTHGPPPGELSSARASLPLRI